MLLFCNYSLFQCFLFLLLVYFWRYRWFIIWMLLDPVLSPEAPQAQRACLIKITFMSYVIYPLFLCTSYFCSSRIYWVIHTFFYPFLFSKYICCCFVIMPRKEIKLNYGRLYFLFKIRVCFCLTYRTAPSRRPSMSRQYLDARLVYFSDEYFYSSDVH